MDDGAADDLREVDPFSSLRLKKRSLLKGRDKLISQIQALPHYNSFRVPLSFDALRSAVLSGFILTNHFNGPPISYPSSQHISLLHYKPPQFLRPCKHKGHVIGLAQQMQARFKSLRSNSSLCARGTLKSRRQIRRKQTLLVEHTRTVARLVMPDICILLTSSKSYGSNPIR